MEQIWKLSLDSARIGVPMCGKIFKIWENGCEVCAHHFDHLEANWKKTSTTAFLLLMCTRIKIFRYLVTGCHEKLSSSYRWYKNLTVGPTFVRTKSLLSRSIFKNVLGLFIGDDNVVVHPCSNFSLRRQMALLQSIKFQTADFPIFCAHIIVIFWTTCIAREVFSVW